MSAQSVNGMRRSTMLCVYTRELTCWGLFGVELLDLGVEGGEDDFETGFQSLLSFVYLFGKLLHHRVAELQSVRGAGFHISFDERLEASLTC